MTEKPTYAEIVAAYDRLVLEKEQYRTALEKIRFVEGVPRSIERIALDLLELLIEAVYRSDRDVLYLRVNLELEKLRIFLRLGHDRQLLADDQLRYAIGEIDEIGRMWHGWAGPKRKRPVTATGT